MASGFPSRHWQESFADYVTRIWPLIFGEPMAYDFPEEIDGGTRI